MVERSHPSMAHGKICYLLIPAADIQQSADFYQKVFGWHVRTRENGTVAFDDSVHEVSGTWVKGRKPATDQSVLVFIMVESVADAMKKIAAHGGKITQGPDAGAREVTAIFADPAGNAFGIYQEPTIQKR